MRTSDFWLYMAVLSAFLLVLTPAKADDVTLTWTNPTGAEQCVDAGPTVVAGTSIWLKIDTINDPSLETYTIPGQLPGEYTYAATTIDDQGEESRMSGKATKTVANFTVQVDTVYTVVRTSNKFLLLPTGTVPVGTTCDVTTNVNGFYGVDTGAVSWTGTIRPQVVVAECG